MPLSYTSIHWLQAALILGCLGLSSRVAAQSIPPENSGSLQLLSVTKAAHSLVRPDATLILEVNVTNVGESPASANVVVSLDDFPESESARTVHVAAQQKETFNVSLLMPQSIIETGASCRGRSERRLRRGLLFCRHANRPISRTGQ